MKTNTKSERPNDDCEFEELVKSFSSRVICENNEPPLSSEELSGIKHRSVSDILRISNEVMRGLMSLSGEVEDNPNPECRAIAARAMASIAFEVTANKPVAVGRTFKYAWQHCAEFSIRFHELARKGYSNKNFPFVDDFVNHFYDEWLWPKVCAITTRLCPSTELNKLGGDTKEWRIYFFGDLDRLKTMPIPEALMNIFKIALLDAEKNSIDPMTIADQCMRDNFDRLWKNVLCNPATKLLNKCWENESQLGRAPNRQSKPKIRDVKSRLQALLFQLAET